MLEPEEMETNTKDAKIINTDIISRSELIRHILEADNILITPRTLNEIISVISNMQPIEP